MAQLCALGGKAWAQMAWREREYHATAVILRTQAYIFLSLVTHAPGRRSSHRRLIEAQAAGS
jgi:hypothetical protein